MQPSILDTSHVGRCKLGEAPRILLVRLSAIGDCILTLPLATTLKRACPDAHLTWIVDCAASQILHRHPSIDQVVRVRKGFLKRPRELFQLRKSLRAHQFDYAIDPQGLFKSGAISWLSGAPQRIGFDSCGTRECASWFYTERRHPLGEHLVDRQLELLETFGIDVASASGGSQPRIDFGWGDVWDDSVGFEGESIVAPFVALNPGAGWESKRWPVDRYAALADRIFSQIGLQSLVFWGNQREYQLAKTITMLAPASTRLAPPTDLLDLARWLSRATAFVGSDTGPMHLAASLGTPTIAMFGTSLASRSGPYGTPHRSLQKRYDGGSARYRRNTTNAAMQAICVDAAFDVVVDVLRSANAKRTDALRRSPGHTSRRAA